MNTHFQQKRTARNYECDQYGKLHLGSLMHWIQDIADTHAEVLGFGYTACCAQKLGWVQISIHAEILQMPELGKEVTVETFTFPTTKIIAGRNCLITDSEGTVLVRATTQWVLISMEKRTPVTLKTLITADYWTQCPNEAYFPESPKKLRLAEALTPIRTFLADRHYIDTNGHVNNASYPTWVLDSFDDTWMNTYRVNYLKAYYLKESHVHDELLISSTTLEDMEHLETHHSLSKDGQDRIHIILQWQEKA